MLPTLTLGEGFGLGHSAVQPVRPALQPGLVLQLGAIASRRGAGDVFARIATTWAHSRVCAISVPQCHGVYRRIDKPAPGDAKAIEYWLPCDYCPNWVHLQCEKTHAAVRLGV